VPERNLFRGGGNWAVEQGNWGNSPEDACGSSTKEQKPEEMSLFSTVDYIINFAQLLPEIEKQIWSSS
jgi:hypothetical protein